MRTEFFIETKVLEEYCCAITQAVWRLCCGLSLSNVFWYGLELHSVLSTYAFDHVYTPFRLA